MRPSRSDKLVSKGLTERFVHEKQHGLFHLHMSIFVHDESCMNALTSEPPHFLSFVFSALEASLDFHETRLQTQHM